MTSWGSITEDRTAPSAMETGGPPPPAGRPVTVLLADDDPALQRTLTRIISSSGSLAVVAVAGDGDEAIRLGTSLAPDVAVVDVSMPGGGGVRVTEILKARSPRTRVLALSGSAEREEVMAMLAAGAVGYLVKGGDFDLVAAVLAADRGQGVLSSDVTAGVIGELSERLLRQRREDQARQDGLARVESCLAGGLGMVFQPVVDLASRTVEGVEALARFAGGPDRTPDRWFTEAWEVGLGYELETAAVEAALAGAAPLPGRTFLAVNLSPQALTDRRCARWLESLRGLDQIVLEITEHANVEDYGALTETLGRARRLGMRVAVDDAGAGYSSFRHVLMLKPDFVKLDGSLISGIDSDPDKRALAVGMIASAREMGIQVIAESIERESELACVLRLGARLGQGYHLGRPGPLPTGREPGR